MRSPLSNEPLIRLEERVSIFGVGTLSACVFFLLSLFSITPTNSTFAINHTNTHAAGYAYLSEHPFDTTHLLFGRVLTPLIAHYIGATGESFVYVPLLVGILFLALVYTYLRAESAPPVLALAGLAIMAFSSAITSMFHLGGLPDTTSFFFLVLTLLLIRTPAWGLPFSAALLNHESGVIYFPMFLTLSYMGNRSRLARDRVFRTYAPFLLSVCAFIGWRLVISATGAYTVTAYVNQRNITSFVNNSIYIPLGMFMSFRLFWAIPLIAMMLSVARRSFVPAAVILSVVLGTLLTLLVASDTSRLTAFGFLAILYGICVLRQYVDDKQLTEMLWCLVAANLFIPTYHVWTTFMSLSPPMPIGYWLTQSDVSYFRDDMNIVPLIQPRVRDISMDRLSTRAPEGAAWNIPGAVLLTRPIRVTLGEARRVHTIRLQADCNDSYRLRLFLGGRETQNVDVSGVGGSGLRTREVDLGGIGVMVDQVMIEAVSGDGRYSVKALELL